ncbi:MAG TPA: hypothetical protein VIH76_07630 [Candidatus Acidoferrales bacterium]
MNRKAIAFTSLVLGVVVFNGCGGSSISNKSTGSNSGTTIELTNAPATLGVGQAVNLRATVGSDAANGGVDWNCTPIGSCGAFSPAHTANGATTSYTAPAAAGTVMIVADASDDSGATASANISVISAASNSVLNGPYVFFVEGTDSTGIYVAAGTIITDGNGNITGGEQDYSDQGASKTRSDPITGIYSVESDGRGSITLNVNDKALPNGGVETFSIAATSPTHALIIEFDGSATSGGTLDFQSANALSAGSIAGSYSFALNGYDLDSAVPAAFGGVANLSAAAGFVSSGAFYANDGGTTQTSLQLNGPVTGPDAFGRGTIRTSVGLNFVYYAVQGEVLRIVEADLPDFLTGGAFVGQGAAGASASFSNSALSGPYAFFESGSTISGRLSLAGQFTADGSGNLSAGFVDTNDGGMNQSGSIAGQAVYSIPGNGTGTLTLPGTATTTMEVSALLIFPTDPALNLLDPNSASGGGGALILDFDNNAIGTGVIVPQALGAFDGDYAVVLGSFDSAGEENFVGQSVANGSGSLAGTVDVNDSFATVSGVTFSGASAADSSNLGRYTGSFTVGAKTYSITYYQASGGEFFVLDTDSPDVGNGALESQGCPFAQACP